MTDIVKRLRRRVTEDFKNTGVFVANETLTALLDVVEATRAHAAAIAVSASRYAPREHEAVCEALLRLDALGGGE